MMVIGAAFYSAIVTFAAAGFGVWIFPRTPWWYAAFVAPGLLPFKLLLRHGHFSSLQNRESWLAFAVTFLYYFGLLFAFLSGPTGDGGGSAPGELLATNHERNLART
jgi:hypothetical protein